MSLFDTLISGMMKIEGEVSALAKQAITENSAEIVMLVKSGQLSKGLNSDGLPLEWKEGTGFYAKATQAFADKDNTQRPKLKGAPYNFSWSGETLDNMKMGEISNDTTYEITTVAFKKRILEDIYGEIFDLTDKHNKFVNETIIAPFLYENILLKMAQI